MIPTDLQTPKTLGDKQRLFAYLVSVLIQHIYESGYSVTFGDTFDTDGDGGHMKGSVHQERLAVDLNLFLSKTYQPKTESHKPFGVFWKSLHPLCRWGGEFKDSAGNPKPDGNHYAITHNGKA